MKITVPEYLIQRCLKGERKAQRELYDLTLPYLRAIVQRHLYNSQEWNDVLQEIYLRIFRSLFSFDSEKGTFLNWSSRIAINASITYGQKAASQETTTLIVEHHEPAVKPLAINNLMVEQILQEMRKMPKDFYQVFMLVSIEGFTHIEASELLGISGDLSRQRLSRAKLWVKKHLQAVELNEQYIHQKLKV
ncbi:MAG: RNA polymerase sigma factor [Flavobacteriales bacterium]|jgi:RNA polymerase sigma factor (sigma-70 family)